MVLPPSAVVAPSFCSHFTSPIPHPCPVFPNLWGVCPGNEDLPALLGATPDRVLLPWGVLSLHSPFRLLCVPCCSWLSSLPRLASRRRFPGDPHAGSANKLIGPLPFPHSLSLCGIDKEKWEKPDVCKFLRCLKPCKALSRQSLCCLVPDSPALPGPVTLLCWLKSEI